MEIRLSVKLDDGCVDITRIGKKPNIVMVCEGKAAERVGSTLEEFVTEIARYCEGYEKEGK